MQVSDKTLKALMTSVNFRQMRQELISSNIANAETPGYRAKRIDFEKALARALDVDGQNRLNTSDKLHHDVGSGGFENIQPEIYEDPNGVVSPDGNSVDVTEEMRLMAENKILYDAAIQLINKKVGLMKYAISADQ